MRYSRRLDDVGQAQVGVVVGGGGTRAEAGIREVGHVHLDEAHPGRGPGQINDADGRFVQDQRWVFAETAFRAGQHNYGTFTGRRRFRWPDTDPRRRRWWWWHFN